MSDLIREVKAALQAATPGPWKDNGNEIVSERNERVGIGGFLTEEDNHLAANSFTWLKQMIERVEEVEWEMSVAAEQQQYVVNMLQSQIETTDKKNEAAKAMLESYGRITADMEDDYKLLQTKYGEAQQTIARQQDHMKLKDDAVEFWIGLAGRLADACEYYADEHWDNGTMAEDALSYYLPAVGRKQP